MPSESQLTIGPIGEPVLDLIKDRDGEPILDESGKAVPSGAIDYECKGWEPTRAKAQVIQDVVLKTLNSRVEDDVDVEEAGGFVALVTKRAPGWVRIYFSANDSESDYVPPMLVLVAHGNEFLKLYGHASRHKAMKARLPAVEDAIAAAKAAADAEAARMHEMHASATSAFDGGDGHM